MPAVAIEAPRFDLERNLDKLLGLADALREGGFDASVQPARWEQRGAGSELVLRVLEDVEAEVIATLAALIVAYVRERLPRRGSRRRVVIYGPRDEVLRVVEIDDETGEP